MQRSTVKRTLIVLLIAGAAALTAYSTAGGHSADWAYGGATWPDDRDEISFRFHKSVPKGRWRLRVSNGAREWNRYGRRLQFLPPATGAAAATTEPYFGCPSGADPPRPSVVFRSTKTSFATTFACYRDEDGRPFYFRMFFDPDQPWWTDPNNNRKIPASRADVQSAATHEFGHATGWGPHYDDNPDRDKTAKVFRPYCRMFRDQTKPNDRPDGTMTQRNLFTGQETMCSKMMTGGVHRRTLGSHDRGTFRNAYPAR